MSRSVLYNQHVDISMRITKLV